MKTDKNPPFTSPQLLKKLKSADEPTQPRTAIELISQMGMAVVDYPTEDLKVVQAVRRHFILAHR